MRFSESRIAAAFFFETFLILGTQLSTAPAYASAEHLKALVIVNPTVPEEEAAFSVLKSHTSDLSVDLKAERVTELSTELKALDRYLKTAAESGRADIVMFCDFSDESSVVLYVSMPKLGTTLIRNIDAKNETVESRLEITAAVIRGILTTMAAGGEIGIHSDEHRAAPNAAASPDPNEKKVKKVGLGTSYGIGIASDETSPAQSIRSSVRLSAETIGVFVAYRTTLPLSKEDETLSLELCPHPVETGVWFSLKAGKTFFRLGAALVFDPITTKVIPKKQIAENKSNKTNFRFAISPLIAVESYLVPHAFIRFSISADIFIYQDDFFVTQGENKTAFFGFWPVSPLFQIGFGFDFIQQNTKITHRSFL